LVCSTVRYVASFRLADDSGTTMADTEPTPKTKTSKRRAEILKVAARVIAERGLAGATVRDIGEAAGILSGSLYHHFESKEEIVLDLLLENVAAEVARAEWIAADAPDATTALVRLIQASVAETAAHPHESLILRNETRAFAELPKLAPLEALRRQSVEIWTEVVRRGMDSGEFDAALEPEVAVMSIVDSALGSARWFGQHRAKDLDVVVSTIVSIHVGGMLQR
jgi:AcrR family transcriptional regulator